VSVRPSAADAVLVRTLDRPNDKLIEVLLAADALRRAGARETLFFPSPAESLAARVPVEEAYPEVEPEPPMDDHYDEAAFYGDDLTPPEEADVGDVIRDYQEQLQHDPDGTLAEPGVSPVSEGTADGYRIGDLADSPYLSQTGLQPGDVITIEIDGLGSITNPVVAE